MRVAVFVVDGHDIELYPDAEAAALDVEGYDATDLDYLGADGTVYEATVEGPEWGPVRLHRTRENRLEHLVRLLRTAAARAQPVPTSASATRGRPHPTRLTSAARRGRPT